MSFVGELRTMTKRGKVARQQFPCAENLERMLVITAFLAVRLLQLRECLTAAAIITTEKSYETVLSEDEWKVPWLSTDIKRTGRPAWDTIWHG